MNFLRIAARIAGASDVQNAVTRACLPYGVYEPYMKQVGPDTYVGDFDTGWELEVQEVPGDFKVKLNGRAVKSLNKAVQAFKKKDLLFAQKSTPSVKTQADWEEEFYPDLRNRTFNNPKHIWSGSQAFWEAFKELDWLDWTPVSDPGIVENKMREMLSRGVWPHTTQEELEAEIESMQYNYKEYKKYEPSYIDGTIND